MHQLWPRAGQRRNRTREPVEPGTTLFIDHGQGALNQCGKQPMIDSRDVLDLQSADPCRPDVVRLRRPDDFSVLEGVRQRSDRREQPVQEPLSIRDKRTCLSVRHAECPIPDRSAAARMVASNSEGTETETDCLTRSSMRALHSRGPSCSPCGVEFVQARSPWYLIEFDCEIVRIEVTH